MKLSVVIPCYNERGNIPLIVARLREVLGTRRDVGVLLVDNGSTDGSEAVIASELSAAADARLGTYRVPVNKGYGYGIMAGLAAADGDVLAWTHADMQTDPADVLKAFDLFQAQTKDRVVIKGRRLGRGLLEVFFTWGMQVFASRALKVRVKDVNAQPKLFDRSFYERLLKTHAPDDFSLDLYTLYQAQTNGYEIVTIPVRFAPRRHGEAKGGGSWRTRIKLIRRTFRYIGELKSRLQA